MPSLFRFDASTLAAAGPLERADLTPGRYPGLDYPRAPSAVAPDQSIATSGGVDVVALAMVAGHTYKLDVDGAALDLELDVIDQRGVRVGGNDDSGGSSSPFLSFTAAATGTYFVAVRHAANDYVDGFFEWTRAPGPTGAYKLLVSAPDLAGAARHVLSDAVDSRSYSDAAQVVKGMGGGDLLWLNGGDDVASGGAGDDRAWGGWGADELSGGSGADRLDGGSGDDVLRGGSGRDRLVGGTGRDSVNGGADADVLAGGDGADVLWGEGGADTLRGGAGADTLRGGAGLDLLYGGTGADSFHFLRGEAPASTVSAEDRIEDFGAGDRIDLSDLAFGRLDWRGAGAFTAANQVRVVELTSGYADVRVNLDRDAAAELEVLVRTVGGFDLQRDDFIL